MRLALAALLLAATALPAAAALPPQYQRQGEIVSIIATVVDAFGFEPITSIVELETDHWRVTAGDCHVDATLVDLPMREPGFAGPRQFEVQVGEVVCE